MYTTPQPLQPPQYRAFASPWEFICAPSQSAPLDLLPGPWQPLICFLLQLSLFENFMWKNYSVCIPCVWLLLLSVSFWDLPMLLCVSVICFPFLNSWIVFHCMVMPQFVFLFTSWRTFGLFLTCGYYEWAAGMFLYKSFLFSLHVLISSRLG